MADIAVTSKLVKGPAVNNELGRGWTHTQSVKWSDFAATAADNDTNTFSLFTVPAYSIVRNVGFRLKTAFDDTGGGSSLTVKIGDATDDDGYVTATQVHLDGTEVFIAANTGAYFTGTDSGSATTANVVKGKTYTSAAEIKAVFTPSSYELEECNAGEIIFFAEILDTNVLISH